VQHYEKILKRRVLVSECIGKEGDFTTNAVVVPSKERDIYEPESRVIT
jgi:hypothetical protein